MAKRKNTKNTKNNKKANNTSDINGIIGIACSIIIMLGLYTNAVGYFSYIAQKLLISLFGLGAFLIPIYIMYLSIIYIKNKGRIILNRNFILTTIIVVNTLILVQAMNFYTYYSPKDGSLLMSIKAIIDANSNMHAGIIGLLVTFPLVKFIGSVGTYIVNFFAYVICLILEFNITLDSLNVKPRNKKASRNSKDNTIEKSHVAPEIRDNNEAVKGISSKIRILDSMKDEAAIDNIRVESTPKIDTYEETKKNISSEDKLDNDVKESINKELNDRILENGSQKEYTYPLVEFLNNNNKSIMNKEDKKELLSNANKLEETLNSFGVDASILQVTKGPSVTRYELQPSAGVKVSKIVNLADDIALSLAANGVRIEAPIPGKSAVGIEVPNRELSPVCIREVIDSDEFIKSNKKLAFALGKDISGKCVVGDLSKMPHILIAGATGSGKSVCINTLIVSLLYKYSPEDVKLLMIDPKVVELNVYNGIPQLLIPVVTDPKKAAAALNWAVNEMTRRYKLFADTGVRNIESYNELINKGIIDEKLPSIVIIVDELADLMMACPKDVEDYICRLAQMARAAGMHLVIATQRPSVDVITGVIKANIPSRISFAVSSQIDSRTILDSSGAEKLLGKGDMLYYPSGVSKPLRIQGCFISESEVEKVVNFIKDNDESVEYKEDILEHINNEVSTESSTEEDERDELLDEAIRIVVESNQVSTSFLQRKLKIGFNRAARIIEQLENMKIIGPREGNKPRQVLISNNDIENQ